MRFRAKELLFFLDSTRGLGIFCLEERPLERRVVCIEELTEANLDTYDHSSTLPSENISQAERLLFCLETPPPIYNGGTYPYVQ